jgi:hypothetical protein
MHIKLVEVAVGGGSDDLVAVLVNIDRYAPDEHTTLTELFLIPFRPFNLARSGLWRSYRVKRDNLPGEERGGVKRRKGGRRCPSAGDGEERSSAGGTYQKMRNDAGR